MITPIQFTSAGMCYFMFHYFDAYNIMSVKVCNMFCLQICTMYNIGCIYYIDPFLICFDNKGNKII